MFKKIIAVLFLSLLLTSCFGWNKQTEKTEGIKPEVKQTFDRSEFREIREKGKIMVHWQEVDISKKSDQDIDYLLKISEMSPQHEDGKKASISTEQYKKNRAEIKQKEFETISQEKKIFAINNKEEAKNHKDDEIRKYYYWYHNDWENGIKDKNEEIRELSKTMLEVIKWREENKEQLKETN